MIVSAALPTGMEGLIYPIPFSSPETLLQVTKHAERLGYHSVWGNDHMTAPHYVREEFPTPPRFWEPLVTFAFLASQTKKLRFGTGVLVMPMRRDIVVLAKQISTLDHLSGGRLEIGAGVGAYREEFEALWPDSKVHRGDMLEEGVEALGRLLNERVASFDGSYYKFRDVELFPKTLQPMLPVYLGGNSPAQIQRLVKSKIATGWLPGSLPIDQLRTGIRILVEEAQKHGRDPAGIQIAPQYIAHVGKTREAAVSRFHQSQMYTHLVSLAKSTMKNQQGASLEDINLIGNAEDVIEKANRFREAGVSHLAAICFAANDVSEMLDQMQIFAEEVMPKIK
jgi:probable F420-dependent oxidoreductase